ncbi:hypothetical protein L3073_15185 [Ancylomarina sp. DW003]|nr:hypothetical protein [Ancylomarina sp. DW003]MDE5423562.1 hypothetical protein [Ancylomarina sp. DW003]
MDYKINPKFLKLEKGILDIPRIFESEGDIIQSGRNLIKSIEIEGLKLNVKSFKVPNLVNKYAYRYLRESKAKRSFLYGCKLLNSGVSTPTPVAYIEYSKRGGLTRSYYISIHAEYDYTFRELIGQKIEDITEVLIEFTRFTYNFHKQGIYFIDHSPGNTLIKEKESGFNFYLVDLNRTKFTSIDMNLGIKNFYRLGSNEEMVKVMAKEYAKLWNADEDYVFEQMLELTMSHNESVRKRKAKKALSKKS